MTDAELHKIAEKTAAFGVHPSGEYIYSFYTEQLQAFAKLVAEHERKACVKVCEKLQKQMTPIASLSAFACSTMIKARGE